MKNVLLAFLVGISGGGYAQQTTPNPFAKGAYLVGLQATSIRGYDNYQARSFVAKAYGGYFIANQLLIGLVATRFQETAPISYRSTTTTIGPMIRYQLTRTRVSPFVVASFQLGQLRANGSIVMDKLNSQGQVIGVEPLTYSSPFPVYSRSLGIGLSAAVTTALRIDLALNWQDIVDTFNLSLDYGYGRYQPQMGITYQIGGRK